MRIATWNVNSLKARLEKVTWWLERARPDVLLIQETKLADTEAPAAAFRDAGYELAHHGERQWNGVAIASRTGIADVVTNFGEPLRPARTPEVGDDEPLAEARMIAGTCGGVRVVSLYAPNGRSVGSSFYQAKLAWYGRLAQWLETAASPAEAMVIGGDFNVAPEDQDVWDPALCPGAIPALAVRTPPSAGAAPFQPRPPIRTDMFRDAGGREHVRLSQGGEQVQLTVFGASLLDAPYLLTELAIPDQIARPRLEAVAAFNRLAQGRFNAGSSRPETRASARLALVLRALDGHLAGASRQQIAISLFGQRRVEREWRDPGGFIRDRVRRAVARGRHIMTSGYLDLLRG